MSFFGDQKLLEGLDFVSGQNGIDSVTESLITSSVSDNKLNNGDFYSIHKYIPVATNAVHDVQFTTPSGTKYNHLWFKIDSDAALTWHLYEGATINLAGTSVTPRNRNRNSSNTSQNTVATIGNPDLASAESDTDTSGATLLAEGRLHANAKVDNKEKLILKANTVYVFRLVAVATSYPNYSLTWFEHTNIN